MGRSKYWVGSLDLTWVPGLGRYLEWGDAVDSDLIEAKDGRFASTRPDDAVNAPEEKEAKHADHSAKEESKGGDDA